jgi:hypothetical protein
METLIKLNDQLAGAPAGVLVVFFCIAIGYLLKGISLFRNRYIPLVVVVCSTGLFMALSPTREPNVLLRIWLTRNFIVGFILGFAAWALHKALLQHIEDKIPGLRDWISKNEPPGPKPGSTQNTNDLDITQEHQ